jgi:hypothetical protein
MATWKKVIVSGSNAELNRLNVNNNQQISSSVADTRLSGSFSGSFSGYFSGSTDLPDLTAGTGISTFTYDGSSTATVAVSGAAQLTDNVLTKWDNISGKFVNSSLFDDGTNITGSSSLILTGAGTRLSGSFSGSFHGNGSDLTGLVTNLVVYGDGGLSGSIDLKTQNLKVLGTTHEVDTTLSLNPLSDGYTVQVGLKSDVAITNTLTVGSATTASGYQFYVTSSINDGTAVFDNSANINAVYLSKGGTKQFEISTDESGVNPIFRLLPYKSNGFIEIGNPSNASNNNTDYVFISENTYGNVLLGPGLSNALSNLPGATASTHKVQVKGPLYISGSTLANGSINVSTGGIIVSGSSTFYNDLTVQGDLTVNGTASFINTQELLVKDRFTLFNSGSTSLTDSGFIFQYSTGGGVASGSSFYLDSVNGTYGRFAVQYDVPYNTTSVTADEWVVTTKFSTADPVAVLPTWGGSGGGMGNMWVNTNTSDIFIWA